MRSLLLVSLLLACLYLQTTAADGDWAPVDNVIAEGISTYGFPGAVVLVGDEEGPLLYKAYGSYTYGLSTPLNGANPAIELDTLFDLASCSKVTGATSAVATFYQRGELDLNQPVSDFLGDSYNVNGKGNVTVLNCLLHNAGYPPDPSPNYWEASFGCPQTANEYPKEDFSCQAQIYDSLLNQTLENPVGEVYVYSDLSFLTLQYIVGVLARDLGYVTADQLIPGCDQGTDASSMCYFEAYTRIHVFEAIGMTSTGWLPQEASWPDCAPTENDTITHTYQNVQIQGQVSDGNAYANGGIAGHAGIFGTASDLFTLAHRIMFADTYTDNAFLNQTTADYFTTEYDNSQSCRALGWSTNDPTAYDYGWDLSCGFLSPKTWMHVGYSGTEICGDPERKLITIMLTNRVYPFSGNDQDHKYRFLFNNAVLASLAQQEDREKLREAGTAHVPRDMLFRKPE